MLIKCLNIFSLKNQNHNILFVVRTTDCPVFEVKAKISMSVPSDVINQSKSIDYRTN